MYQPRFSEKKFSELVLYIALRSEDDRLFGATKLNKVLFYADFQAFLNWGAPITGATYQKLTHGPAPKQLLPTKQKLIANGDVLEREVQLFRGTRKRIIPLREPDLSVFSADEIALVDTVMAKLASRNAQEVSDMTHELPGWILPEIGEAMPYETVFLGAEMPELTVEQVELGKRIGERVNASA